MNKMNRRSEGGRRRTGMRKRSILPAQAWFLIPSCVQQDSSLVLHTSHSIHIHTTSSEHTHLPEFLELIEQHALPLVGQLRLRGVTLRLTSCNESIRSAMLPSDFMIGPADVNSLETDVEAHAGEGEGSESLDCA